LRAREDPDTVAAFVQGFADDYNARGSNKYANNVIGIANTFFKMNKIKLDLHGYYEGTRSRRRPEYIPSLSEALRMADVARSLRDRLIVLLLTYTGFRNSTLRALIYNETYPNDPALQEYTIKKELEKGKECIIMIVHEAMKERVPSACKNRIFYYTFIPPKVTECFRLYMKEKEERCKIVLNDLDPYPVFNTENRRIPFKERFRTPISIRELQDIVKKLAKRAGIKNWKYVYPHCLRKTYENFLRNQPDEVRLDVKEREFLFGHILPGSQDTYFDKKIEELREKYSRMIFEPIEGVKTEERVISEDELQTYLLQGWHFEATLPSGKIVVSRKAVIKKLTENMASMKPPLFSKASTEKESLGEPSKMLEQNQLPQMKQDSPIHSTTQNTDHKENQASIESNGHDFKEDYVTQATKQTLNLESNPTSSSPFKKLDAKQKRSIRKRTSRNKPHALRQRKLSHFFIHRL
jgi:integrase